MPLPFINSFRCKAYLLLDYLKHNPINNHYEEISFIQNNPFAEQPNSLRKAAVKNLLQHTVDTVPYYKKHTKLSLDSFPVMNKKMIQDKFEFFKSNSFLEKKLYKVATSGSTGVPFMLFHNRNKRKRNTADVLYFMGKTGYGIGNKLIELEVWRGHNSRALLRNWLQNSIQFDIAKLTEERIQTLLHIITTYNDKKYLLGFASALETICKYLDKTEKTFVFKNIQGITANSEFLNDYTRQATKKHFGAPIYSRYSNEEIGILAHQTSTSGSFFEINLASYFLEILDMEKDIPAKKGSLGRLIITDLYNYSMPLIRYDTGDVGIFKEDDNRYLRVVEGRKMDMVYDTMENVLSSYIVYTKFYPYYDLLNQYQFIQLDKGEYKIKLNVKSEFNFEKELIKAVKDDFGKDAKVNIEYVDKIPSLSSGKRKKVVNLMNSNSEQG